jgi:hypothetical protein
MELSRGIEDRFRSDAIALILDALGDKIVPAMGSRPKRSYCSRVQSSQRMQWLHWNPTVFWGSLRSRALK